MMISYKGIILSYQSNPFASHQPALIWGIENTNGDVLELGMGDGSTFLINDLLKNSNRRIVSVEDNSSWAARYYCLKNERHRIDEIDPLQWKEKIDELSNYEWGVVFVDQHGNENRLYAVEKLANRCDYLIMHDSDDFSFLKSSEKNWYEYIPKLQAWPERKGPPTFIISRRHEIDVKLLELL